MLGLVLARPLAGPLISPATVPSLLRPSHGSVLHPARPLDSAGREGGGGATVPSPLQGCSARRRGGEGGGQWRSIWGCVWEDTKTTSYTNSHNQFSGKSNGDRLRANLRHPLLSPACRLPSLFSVLNPPHPLPPSPHSPPGPSLFR